VAVVCGAVAEVGQEGLVMTQRIPQGIGEEFGEHPRKPGPRLMRDRWMGPVACMTEEEWPRLEEGLAAQATAHQERMSEQWASARIADGLATREIRSRERQRERQREMARRLAEMQLNREAGAAD